MAAVGDDVSLRVRRGLVDRLRRDGHLHSDAVAAAFLAVPREVFLPAQAERDGLAAVYRDEAIVTRRDPTTGEPTSSSSQPAIMAPMLEALDVRPGHRVLEIGGGTGYNAALLAQLAGPHGVVISIELDAGVAAEARAALLAVGSPARVVVADGRAGIGSAGPVDRIIVTASTDVLPHAWYEDLVPGGRLVVPLRLSRAFSTMQAVVTFVAVGDGFRSEQAIGGGFMPLRGGDRPSPPGRMVVRQPAEVRHDLPLAELAGPAIGALDAAARRDLLATARRSPRLSKVDLGHGGSWTLDPFLTLAVAEEHLVDGIHPSWVGSRHALGVFDPADRSLAFVLTGAGRFWIETYGASGAEAALCDAIREWRELGRPGVDRLQIRVCYGAAPPRAWRTVRRSDQWMALDWSAPASAGAGLAPTAPGSADRMPGASSCGGRAGP